MSVGLGQGLAFPPRVGADGRLALSRDEDNVRQAIRLLLLTRNHERVMRAEYGAGLKDMLFEPNTASTRELMRRRITAAITRWEPRVKLSGVSVEPDESEGRRVIVTVNYTLVATGGAERVSIGMEA